MISSETRLLQAYEIGGQSIEIVKAFPDRPWMDAFHTTFANRCLPMRIANQAGWFFLNPAAIEIVWNGGERQRDLTIRSLSTKTNRSARSHFGHGIITWWLPYLFRTPPGFNMHVRGPANWCKEGIIALDALVETDWSVASFPMSWRCLRPGEAIRFEEGEPICMISPIRRDDIEHFAPVIDKIEVAPDLKRDFRSWSSSRDTFNKSLTTEEPLGIWQKHYFLGTHPGAKEDWPSPGHQVKLNVRNFHDRRPKETSDSLENPLPDVKCPYKQVSSPIAPNEVMDLSQSLYQHEPCFFDNAPEMRRFIDLCLGGPHQRTDVSQQVWQYKNINGIAQFLTADIRNIFPRDLVSSFERRLRSWLDSHSTDLIAEELHLVCYPAGWRQRPSTLCAPGAHSIIFVLSGAEIGERPAITLKQTGEQIDHQLTLRPPFLIRKQRLELRPAFNDLLYLPSTTAVGVNCRGKIASGDTLLLLATIR